MHLFLGNNLDSKEILDIIHVVSSSDQCGSRTLQDGVGSQTSQNHLHVD